MRDAVSESIRDAIDVPSLIHEIAAACVSDLLYGPKLVLLTDGTAESFDEDHVYSHGAYPEDDERRKGDWFGSLYTSPAADALRSFIEDLPTLYLDEDDYVHTSEPSTETMDLDDEDDETGQHTYVPAYSELSHTDVVEALFGRTIAREFK